MVLKALDDRGPCVVGRLGGGGGRRDGFDQCHGGLDLLPLHDWDNRTGCCALEHGAGPPVDELLVEDACLLQQILVALVAEHFQRVEDFDVRVTTEREAEAAAESLLRQQLGDRRAHRGDHIDVLDVPALLEHPYRDDDPVRVVELLQLVQSREGLVRALTREAVAELRDKHLYEIKKPMLFVSGTKDTFGRKDLLEKVLDKIGDSAQVLWIEGGDHSFKKSGSKEELANTYQEVLAKLVEWGRSVRAS